MASTVAALLSLLGGSSLADAPAGRYQVGSGTVTDLRTGLVWQQTVDVPLSWANAVNACQTSALPGTGWRLPTVGELMTLVDHAPAANAKVMIDPMAFPDTSDAPTGARYWTSTPLAEDDSYAWTVSFSSGTTGEAGKTASSQVRARCVRSAN